MVLFLRMYHDTLGSWIEHPVKKKISVLKMRQLPVWDVNIDTPAGLLDSG